MTGVARWEERWIRLLSLCEIQEFALASLLSATLWYREYGRDILDCH
jgi:hypothetical protein